MFCLLIKHHLRVDCGSHVLQLAAEPNVVFGDLLEVFDAKRVVQRRKCLAARVYRTLVAVGNDLPGGLCDQTTIALSARCN